MLDRQQPYTWLAAETLRRSPRSTLPVLQRTRCGRSRRPAWSRPSPRVRPSPAEHLAVVALNVLHISESDAAGGAARTAYKVHRGLKEQGHVSRMLVGRKVTGDTDIRRIKRNDAWRVADRACGEVLDRLDLQYAFYPSSFGVARDPWFRAADVVQLHNLHGSYFSYTALPVLTRRRPVVWLLQDQWAYTGHVAYSLDCERWRHGCGSCPYLGEYPR